MHIVQPAFTHLDNNHALDREQSVQLKAFNDKVSEFFNYIINLLKNKNFDEPDELVVRRDELLEMANEILINRVKILKKTQKGVKVSVTYMEMLSETKSLLLHVVQLVKANINLLESSSTDESWVDEGVLDE
jgi:Na+/phosphate symporter